MDELINAVRELKEGNMDAFQTVYILTKKSAQLTIRKYCDNSSDEEDILQDTYIKLLESIQSLKNDESIQAYINKIAANSAIRFNMRKKPTLFSELENEEGQMPDFENENMDYDPAAVADKDAISQAVCEVLNMLPEDQRDALWMVYGQRTTIREMAESLGISENTIKSRLYQGRQKLQANKAEFQKRGIEVTAIPIAVLIAIAYDNTTYAAETGVAAGVTAAAAASSAVADSAEVGAGVSTVATGATTVSDAASIGAAAASDATVSTAITSGEGMVGTTVASGEATVGATVTTGGSVMAGAATTTGGAAATGAAAAGVASAASGAAGAAAAATGLSLAAKIGIVAAVVVIGGGTAVGVTAVRSPSTISAIVNRVNSGVDSSLIDSHTGEDSDYGYEQYEQMAAVNISNEEKSSKLEEEPSGLGMLDDKDNISDGLDINNIEDNNILPSEIPSLDEADKILLQEVLAFCLNTDDSVELINYIQERQGDLHAIGEKYFAEGNVLFDGEELIPDGSGIGIVLKNKGGNLWERNENGDRELIAYRRECHVYVGEFSDGLPNGNVKLIAMDRFVDMDDGRELYLESPRVLTAESNNGIWDGKVTIEAMDAEEEYGVIVRKADGEFANGIMDGHFVLWGLEGYGREYWYGLYVPDQFIIYELDIVDGVPQSLMLIKDDGVQNLTDNMDDCDLEWWLGVGEASGTYYYGSYSFNREYWNTDFSIE